MPVALWISFAPYDERCSVRTWAYRVAHNVATTHIGKERRANRASRTLDDIEHLPDAQNIGTELETSEALAHALIRRFQAPGRQVMILYLEGLDPAAIADITGFSPGAIATRISRLKAHLTRSFHELAHA